MQTSSNTAFSARLLKVANAPYFGHSGSIETLDDAVALLGLDMILSMAATHKLFAVTRPSEASTLNLDQLWEHCVYVASLTRKLGYALRVPQPVLREAATAALLHDIGKLVLAYAAPNAFAAALRRAKSDHMPIWQSEYSVFGNHHAEVGGCLLNLWGLPPPVVEAVSMHHTPHTASETKVSSVELLHIADALAHANDHEGPPAFLDQAHLKSLNIPDDLCHWQDVLLNA